jgi:hypothetical protein
MARSLSTPTKNAIAAQLTQPGYLVHIGWAAPVRLSSRGDMTWNGNVYIAAGVMVSGLDWSGSAEQTGSILLNNAENLYSATALNEGVADVPIDVWLYDGAATATSDPVQLFAGVGDSCSILPQSVTIKVTSTRTRSQFSPRAYITQDNGFSIVPPEGRIISWGGTPYRFERSR